MGANPDFAKSGQSFVSGAVAKNGVLIPKKCVVHSITVNAVAAEFILLFDATAVPADTATTAVEMFKVAAGGVQQYIYPRGKVFGNGLAWSTSTTGPVLTGGAVDGWIAVTADV